jgi:peptidylprolyl isomerase
VRSRILVFSLAAGALLAACSSSSPGAGSATTAAPATTATSSAAGASNVTWSPAGTFGTEPTVVVPSGSPPSQLLSHDLIVGTGATATDGSTVTVQYVGYSWTTKKKFDASWDRNQPFVFTLGAGQVIPGWDQGVVGMKVGGRRELIIPPELAYGSQSPTPAIASNDTLIFVIDLLKVS